MQTTLLSTKLFLPPPGSSQVNRPRLNSTLEHAFNHALTLVSAPAGYGKTTLVSSWLNQAGVPSAWLSLDEEDDDPVRFLQYFLAALHTVVPGIRIDMVDMLQGSHQAAYYAFISLIINQVLENSGSAGDHFIFVMDDFQVIHTKPILEMLTFLFDHLPQRMHVLLITRSDPPIQIARLRARNQLVEIRADQLRFTPAEVNAFLNEELGLELPAGDLSAIEARTEGWIAGLQLAGLSMQGCTDVHNFISAFSGSHSYIMDYLVEEVLKLQPEEVRTFLLKTSVLERMSGQLCDEVIASDLADPISGQAMLESLEHQHLFIIPLDNERRWYRYHQLFKDVLNRRLESLFPGLIPDLHCRASCWYEQNGFIHEAVQHAHATGNMEFTAGVVDRHGCSLLMRAEIVTLLKWLEWVEPYIPTRPWLTVQKAWGLLLAGRQEHVEAIIQSGEQLVAQMKLTDEVRTIQGSFAAARAQLAAMQGNATRAQDFARKALEFTPESSDFSCSLRSASTSILGDASRLSGELDTAWDVYRDALRIGQAADNPHMVLIANTNMAKILVEQGQLQAANRLYKDSLQMAIQVDGQNSPFADQINFGLSEIYYELNQLAEASQYILECIRLCQLWGNLHLLTAGYIFLARLEAVQGNLGKVEDTLATAEHLFNERPGSPNWSKWVEASLARLWLSLGNLEKVQLLLRNSHIAPDFIKSGATADIIDIPYALEPEYRTLLHLYQTQGNQDGVLYLARKLLSKAETSHRTGRIIEALVQIALAFQAKKDLPQAQAALEKAISLAQPEGFSRVFLDEGEPMARLLYQAKTRGLQSEFSTKLLSSMVGQTSPTRSMVESPKNDLVEIKNLEGQSMLVEPLSVRELEILNLISTGSSNQDIAVRLFISEKTVKRHISNIYAKLGVKSRTQAVSCAKALRILE